MHGTDTEEERRTSLSHPPPPFYPTLLHICVNFMSSCWSSVFWCYNGGTSLSYRPPLRPKLLHICVSFMNSCWSPVFWCNNGGTSLSHRPPFALNCFISVSVLWIHVEVPYFDVTMVELRSLTPPPPFALNCFISVSVLWIPVEVPYFDVTMVELRSLTPPLRPKLLHICVSFMNSCWSPVFWCNNGGTLLSHPPPFALNCFISV